MASKSNKQAVHLPEFNPPSSVCFEGGYRGGCVSEPETLPAPYMAPKERGYDEHDAPRTAATVHGVPGVEGLEGGEPASDDGGDGMGLAGRGGHACMDKSCGFTARSTHGLARHMVARHGYSGVGKTLHGLAGSANQVATRLHKGGLVHGGFGGLGGHGCSYDDVQRPGESDDAPKMKQPKQIAAFLRRNG